MLRICELFGDLEVAIALQRAAKVGSTITVVDERTAYVQTVFGYEVRCRRERLRHMQLAIAFMRGHSLLEAENNTLNKPITARPKVEEVIKYLPLHWRWNQSTSGRNLIEAYFIDMVTRWIEDPYYHPEHVKYLKRRFWKVPKAAPKDQKLTQMQV